ncbi:helix-turn-helix domain-containing protein [Gellertiella hungarica]|uniref:Transcriptional regulator with XRE-family HTH domain n=1 Tax=Gellertiella hungarica TaxID=1572859 RepID=A0A7W6NKD5_9HYPH|nr:helix-turn-helix domain-containing protein [Gellertiella hungarica]MBB4064449.1 transcriptional regulator with XRE-family HTH domain [Gellertiella hungarica]
MSVDWKTLRADLPAEVQERLDHLRLARRLGRALSDLRKEARLSQQQIAESAKMTQNTVSRIEKADDILLSSLARYMQALGGTAEIVLKDGAGRTRLVTVDVAPPAGEGAQ